MKYLLGNPKQSKIQLFSAFPTDVVSSPCLPKGLNLLIKPEASYE